MSYRYKLETYKGSSTRYTCPSCTKQRTFSRYIDIETGLHLASKVGRCDREINCGYHLTPKQYFESNKNSSSPGITRLDSLPIKIPEHQAKPISTISKEIFLKSLRYPSQNNLIAYFQSLFGIPLTCKLVDAFCLGTSKYWPGATVFWQIDSGNRIRTGKIMLYAADSGKRVRSPHNHISWVHGVLGFKNFNLSQCFFGEHLLNTDLIKPVAIVESEKTAIIASVYMPQFIWMACGSVNNLTMERFRVLSNRHTILFPDLCGFEKWQSKAAEIQKNSSCKIIVSELLEKNASSNEKSQGLDIADYLVKRDDKFGWALSSDNYPLFWDKQVEWKK